MRFYFLFFAFLLSAFSIAYAIEVGGHLTEDTTWSPENNPYLVTEILYVDAGVTLTILPGTEIKISGASLTNYYEAEQNFWLYSGDSIAKFIQVDGRLIAEGTEQDSIIFTRMQDDPDFCWGTIRITEDAELCRFKYCKIEHSCLIGIALSYISKGLDFFNGNGSVRNCTFLNNAVGINSNSYTKELEIINNEFIIDNNVNPFLPVFNYGRNHIMSSRNNYVDSPNLLICNNNFEGYGTYFAVGVEQLSFYNNTISNCVGSGGYIVYFVNNKFNDCDYGIIAGDSLYIKNNRFIGGIKGIDIDYAYVEISNNYFEGCELDTGFDAFGKIFNNKIDEGNVFIGINMEYYNNILVNYIGASCALAGYNVHNIGNIIINNETAFYDNSDTLYTNSIILQNEELFWSPIQYGTDTFRNCIIDFELEYPLIDGGGNIWVDSVQTQELFEDIQNGDFHLIEGSLAIDAGLDTLGYYYPFDMDYNHRVWDGDGNGTAIIDIGPYEYNSPSFGGIEGYTYNPIIGDPVDYVLLKINNQPGEFTFSDSIGNFEYKLPAGIYDVYAERVFYEDVIEYQVEVIDGQFTQVLIPMLEIVDVEKNTIPNSSSQISNLTNYPNPFNPSTTISFSVTQNSDFVTLEIFNIKGQKVKRLSVTLSVDEGSDNNYVSTPSPSTTLRMTQAGSKQYSVVWNGTNENNKSVSSGIYLYKIKVGNQESVKRMLLLK